MDAPARNASIVAWKGLWNGIPLTTQERNRCTRSYRPSLARFFCNWRTLPHKLLRPKSGSAGTPQIGKESGYYFLGRNSLNSRLHKGSPPCARPARSAPNGYLAVVPSSVRCTADSARATTVPLGSGTPGANRSHSDEKLGGGALRHLCMWTACTIACSRSESGATCARHTSSKLAAKPTTSLAASVFSGRSLPTGNGWRTRQFAGLCMASRRIGPELTTTCGWMRWAPPRERRSVSIKTRRPG